MQPLAIMAASRRWSVRVPSRNVSTENAALMSWIRCGRSMAAAMRMRISLPAASCFFAIILH
jgi:hypothetical protein